MLRLLEPTDLQRRCGFTTAGDAPSGRFELSTKSYNYAVTRFEVGFVGTWLSYNDAA